MKRQFLHIVAIFVAALLLGTWGFSGVAGAFAGMARLLSMFLMVALILVLVASLTSRSRLK